MRLTLRRNEGKKKRLCDDTIEEIFSETFFQQVVEREVWLEEGFSHRHYVEQMEEEVRLRHKKRDFS